jgi:MarR family transcriptional regulator, multiple antibiotic resistance protein MarR
VSGVERGTGSPWSDVPGFEVFANLVRVQTRLWNDVDAHLRERHGVPFTELTALEVVASTPECRVQDVVETLHITVGGASKAVDRLAATGLVRRVPNPHDRRSSVVLTTPKGVRLLERALPDLDEVLDARLVSALSKADLSGLGRILTRLEDHS